jgi:hypothetical protein
MSTETLIDTTTLPVNERAMRDMLTVSKTCNTGDALAAGLEDIIRRYSAREVVAKCYGNGLVSVAVLDKDGLLIGTYTRTATKCGEA